MTALPTSTEAPPVEARSRDLARGAAVLRPAWAEIDLDALTGNLARLRRRSGSARVLAIVKADAYGHGAPPVSRALEAAGVDWLGAALVEEGAEIRRAGVNAPLLVLGVASSDQLPLYRRYRLTPTVSGLDQLHLWREYLAGGTWVQPIHLKVDTGMRRLGIALDEVGEALTLIRATPALELAGVLSHFADADQLDSLRSALQEERFEGVLAALTPAERHNALIHFANSAGDLHRPTSHFDLVRLGLALYGHDPAGVDEAELEAVMAVKTRLVLVRDVPDGGRVGYGGRWVSQGASRIGILPVGYADGYSWRLWPAAEALVRGRRVGLAGAPSMDMSFVDVTAAGGAVGDEVVLLGRQGGERITVAELARHAETLPYELLCLLGLRLARRYVRGGEVVEVVSRFEGSSP
jgi:alanine racemase